MDTICNKPCKGEIASSLAITSDQVRGVSPALRLVNSSDEYERVMAFRRCEYRQCYPQVSFEYPDPFDQQALIFYSADPKGKICSTARLVFDSSAGGLPDEAVMDPWLGILRRRGHRLAELGRFIINSHDPTLVKQYYRVFYEVSRRCGIDNILMVMRQKEVKFHRKRIGAQLLNFNTGLTFGSKHEFALVNWPLRDTSQRFLRWLQLPRSTRQVEG